MIAALIFDVDGTLAETEEYHRRAFNAAFVECGLGWNWDGPLYRRLLKVTGGKERILAYADTLAPADRAGIAERVGDIHRRKTALYTAAVSTGAVPLRPGMTDLIAGARAAGIACAIATTTTFDNVVALMAATLGSGWREQFPVVAAGDMVTRKKPAPDVYHLALAELDLPAGACLAIEDSRNGVEAARAAGLAVAAVHSAYAADDDLSGATAVFPDSSAITLSALRALV